MFNKYDTYRMIDGVNWYNNSPNIDITLNSVKFFDSNTGYASVKDGSIIRTTNGGNNWVRTPTGSLNGLNFYFLNSLTGWAVNTERVLRTTNGGLNWINTGFLFNQSQQLFCLPYFINENTGWIGTDSGKIFKTTNSGFNWIQYKINTPSYILNIIALDINSLLVSTLGVDTIRAKIYRSSNGGNNWQITNTTPTNFYSNFSFINSSIGWVGTWNGKLQKTTNGGLNWFIVYDSVDDFRFRQIMFLNENTGWAMFFSIFSKTTNSGLNWISQVAYSGNAPVNCFDFINENTGWAVGDYGLILKTTNGGLIFVEQQGTEIPKEYSLHQNYPNPFNPSTKIKLSIPSNVKGETSNVKLFIYDVLGKEIATLVNEQLNPGTYEVEWNAGNYPSGIYFYTLTTSSFTQTKKMVLEK